MSINVFCSGCFQQYKVKDELLGKKIKCKHCGEAIRVQEEEQGLYGDYGSTTTKSTTKKKEIDVAGALNALGSFKIPAVVIAFSMFFLVLALIMPSLSFLFMVFTVTAAIGFFLTAIVRMVVLEIHEDGLPVIALGTIAVGLLLSFVLPMVGVAFGSQTFEEFLHFEWSRLFTWAVLKSLLLVGFVGGMLGFFLTTIGRSAVRLIIKSNKKLRFTWVILITSFILSGINTVGLVQIALIRGDDLLEMAAAADDAAKERAEKRREAARRSKADEVRERIDEIRSTRTTPIGSSRVPPTTRPRTTSQSSTASSTKTSGSSSSAVDNLFNEQSRSLLLHEFRKVNGHVTEVAMNHDGTYVVSCYFTGPEPKFLAWEVGKTDEIGGYAGHSSSSGAKIFGFAKDKNHVITTTISGGMHVWDVETQNNVCEFRGRTSGIQAAAFSFDGERIASTDFSRKVTIWKADSGQPLGQVEGSPDALKAIGVSEDGKTMTGIADQELIIWNADMPGPPRIVTVKTSSSISEAILSRDGSRGVIRDSEGAHSVDASTGALTHTLYLGTVAEVDLAADGSRAAVSLHDGQIMIFNMDSGDELVSFRHSSRGGRKLGMSGNGTRLATTSGDKMIRVWKLPPRSRVSPTSDSGDKDKEEDAESEKYE